MALKFVVAGGSGFVGKALTRLLVEAGHEVVVLSRSTKSVEGARAVVWDGRSVGSWASELEGAHAVVNLCGSPVSKRHTPTYFEELRSSRIDPTRVIGEALKTAQKPPRVWVNASAIGYYGDRGGELLGESAAPGTDPLAKLCVEWEAACLSPELSQVRRCTPRFGVVLGHGGAFEEFKKIPAGGIGSGEQYVSWIHVDDLARFVVWCIESNVQGPINAVAPHPVRNRELFGVLNEELGRPSAPPIPEPVFRLTAKLMGLEASVALVSQRCDARLALIHGFSFAFPTLRLAVQDLLDNVPPAWRSKVEG